MMRYKRQPVRDKNMERAIKFLSNSLETSSRNPKPVALHSTRVGMHLDELSYSDDIVIAGILHDVIEDTAVRIEEIEDKFGKKVARIVRANSYDNSIVDRNKRYEDTFKRCLKEGRDALVVKAADILDNSFYYSRAPSREMEKDLLERMKLFINLSQPILKNDPIWEELKAQYERIAKK